MLHNAGDCHVRCKHYLTPIATVVKLFQLGGLGGFDLGASLRFRPGHDVQRHADDLPGRDLLSKSLLTLGLKPRNAFGPVRVAVTGRRISPPLFESLELLGRDISLARHISALS